MTAREFLTTAVAVGFKGDALKMCLAIAYPESKLNENAVGDTTIVNDTWGPSIGLMQIRTIKNPNSNETYRGIDKIEKLKIPRYNLESAYIISRGGTDWRAWATYLDGKYKSYLPVATEALAQYYSSSSKSSIIIPIALGATIAYITSKRA